MIPFYAFFRFLSERTFLGVYAALHPNPRVRDPARLGKSLSFTMGTVACFTPEADPGSFLPIEIFILD